MLKSKSSSKEKVSVILFFFIILLQSQITSVYCQNNNQFESTKGSQTRNEPRNGENNLTYFSRIKKEQIEDWKKWNNSSDYTHPDFGILPKDAPCEDCVEVLNKRKSDERYFVNIKDTSMFYIQRALGDINYLKDGKWVAINTDLKPIASNVYESSMFYEPVGFEIDNQRTYVKTPKGKVYFNNWTLWTRTNDNERLAANANWSNYTIGDDGMYVNNIFNGIDAELVVSRGAIKTNFIIKKNLYGAFDALIFKDNLAHNSNLSIEFENAPGIIEMTGSLVVKSQQELLQINPAYVYPKNGEKSLGQEVDYTIDNTSIGIVVPFDWINNLIDQYELVIDPLVTGIYTLAQASITGSRYNSTCTFTNSCDYTLPISTPANAEIVDLTWTFSYTASGLCWLEDGAVRFSLNSCISPSATGIYWFCNSVGTGTCNGNNVSIFNDVNSCLPSPSCTPQTMDITLQFFRTCYGATGCSSSCIGAASPLVINVIGRTVELPDPTSGGITINSPTVCQNTPVSVSTDGASYGVAPYTYSWSLDASGTPEIATGDTATITFPNVGPQELYLFATDNCGVITSISTTIDVTTAIVLDEPNLSDITNQCSVTIDISNYPTATNQCTGEILTATTANPVTYSSQGTYTILWEYTDSDGNTASQTQQVIIDDSTLPVTDVVSLPDIIEQCEVTSLIAPTATDNCDGTIIGTTTEVLPITASTTVTWTFTDSSGNSSTQNQNVLIEPLTLVITNPLTACANTTVDITAASITSGSTGNGILTYWNDDQATNPLNNPTTISVSGTYYIQSSNGNCTDIKPVQVTINNTPTASIMAETICSGSTGMVTINGTPNTVVTYSIDGGTPQTIAIGATGSSTLATPTLTTSSIYRLESIRYQNIPYCEVPLNETATVNVINPLTDFTVTINNTFSENTSITVNTTDTNTQVFYQLAGQNPQTSNQFFNVLPGFYTINVFDSYNCFFLSKQVSILGYPKFFTPNGDGYNDTWNIIGVQPNSKTKLYIYNRYGQLIVQLNPFGDGWDGTYIGKPLPSNDYWFTLEYEENNQLKTYKSHFSLKR